MNKCKFCGQERKNKNSLINHERLCSMNPKRQKTPFQNLEWQKEKGTNRYIKAKKLGLDKPKISSETREKLKRKRGNCHTEEFKQRQRERAKERNLGGVRQSKWIHYNGKILGSTYELKVVKDLEENGIAWDTCKWFNYIDPFGKVRRYTPDIYLPEYDVYLDPKNEFLINNVNPHLGFTDIEKIKLVEEQNKIKVIVLNKNNLSWKSIKVQLFS